MTALSPTFVTKGADRNREEYGAFSQPSPEELALLQTGNVVVCGIAGDYCVLETLKNVLKVRPDAQVFLEGIASIAQWLLGATQRFHLSSKTFLTSEDFTDMNATTFNERSIALLTDLYEITMANGYFEEGRQKTEVVFDVFYRQIPDQGGFAIFAGLEQIVEYIEQLHF